MKISLVKQMIKRADKLSISTDDVDSLYLAKALCERVKMELNELTPIEVTRIQETADKNLPAAWDHFWKRRNK